MRTRRSRFRESEVLRHAVALGFAVLVLLSCKLAEEIELREDGSGVSIGQSWY